MEEIVRKTELITSNVTEVSGTNGSNLTDMVIEGEEEEEGNDCFGECFDDKVLNLRQKIKTISKSGSNKSEKIYGGISSWKAIF